jgi:hypothetical protein
MKSKKSILILAILFCIGLIGLQAQTVKDADGNVYKTATIGAQLWIDENLIPEQQTEVVLQPFRMVTVTTKDLSPMLGFSVSGGHLPKMFRLFHGASLWVVPT